MSQGYTPVEWVDETPDQMGTIINKARLDQMQTAHHYADGFEEVDTVPTEAPGVNYHKVVFCTADTTFYRWDGTQWTKDVDDSTLAILEAHEADHGNPHEVTKTQVGLGNCDNTSDADKPVSTAQQTALDAKLDDTQLITSWGTGGASATDSNIPSAKLTKDTLDTKLDDTQVVSAWQGTPDNAHIPTEKLVKDGLNAKVDDTQVVSSWQSTTDNDHIPTEKLTKDTIDGVASDVSDIQDLIPTQATSVNQLADKDFVNSSIATNTANFLGTYDAETDLGFTSAQVDAFTDPPGSTTEGDVATAIVNKLASLSKTPTNNDYVFISVNKSTTTAPDWFWRFKYNGTAWVYEFTLNNSSFTSAQWSAINSGITGTLVTTYSNHVADKANPHQVTKSQIGLGNVDNTSDINKPISNATQTALDAKVDDSQIKSSWSSPLSNDNIPGEKLVKDTIDGVASDLATHEADTANPHSVTKAQVGLGSVVNAGMDNAPTANSDNYVKSGGVYAAIPKITISSSAPTGGSDGDIWLQY